MRARMSRTLLAELPRDAAIVTVTDAYPEALSWLGGVCGHRVRALGVEHFGQSGSIPELYGHYGLDVNAILAAAEGISGRPVRYRFSAEVSYPALVLRSRTMTRQFTAIIEREDDGYVALCPELDIASQGDTIESARANLQEALRLFLESASPEELKQRLREEVYVTRVEVVVG